MYLNFFQYIIVGHKCMRSYKIYIYVTCIKGKCYEFRKTFLLGAIPSQNNKQFVMCVFLGRSGNSKLNLFLGFSPNKVYYDILTRQRYKMQTANFRLDTKWLDCRLGTKWRLGITTGFCQIHNNLSFCNLHNVTQKLFWAVILNEIFFIRFFIQFVFIKALRLWDSEAILVFSHLVWGLHMQ